MIKSTNSVIEMTWRNFQKKSCGISAYHNWIFKPQISSIFNFRYVKGVRISGVLGVKVLKYSRNCSLQYTLIPWILKNVTHPKLYIVYVLRRRHCCHRRFELLKLFSIFTVFSLLSFASQYFRMQQTIRKVHIMINCLLSYVSS